MKSIASNPKVRVVVEVDGKPVGFFNLDIGRLWPLINHRIREISPAEWIDRRKFQTVMRAVVMRSLSSRLQPQLYSTLGGEMVKAELDIEEFSMKAEAFAQAFGRSRKDIEKLAAKTGNTSADFYEFFWKFMTDGKDNVDPKKAWKAASRKR